MEASVSPQGKLVDMSDHEPGSVSDLTIFRKRHDTHVANLTKTPSEATIKDNGELHQTFPNMWAVRVDKGYIGLTECVHPKKRPTHGALDRLDLERNAAVSADRAIVENFFGRVCILWKIAYSTFVWGTKIFDRIQRLTFALTNFHVGLMPLREDDSHHYRSVLARYARMTEEKITQRAMTRTAMSSVVLSALRWVRCVRLLLLVALSCLHLRTPDVNFIMTFYT
ncbi:hypothetical protein H310_05400 [Aphanomyces invadans]|uniref:DDE Tnp4 domain-containing protein n=1 Tax=Aphanomyces invadans TaxID=157072 RepID=A0A024UBH6_9STRA|nr:hypothetical protein H310_05400 [Aphanomyces invadans]ETW02958.1 hypothetical protein H310_05400 [Aphanomyces invadans]|eukprot:XP_008868342.1 hypothetical protein H310_05400 [Aphanomyces invadans]